MVAATQADAFRGVITKALEFKDKNLKARPERGAISFEKADLDFRRVFEVLAHLDLLPVEYLTDASVQPIQAAITDVVDSYPSSSLRDPQPHPRWG